MNLELNLSVLVRGMWHVAKWNLFIEKFWRVMHCGKDHDF
jgi:hypothetical protein